MKKLLTIALLLSVMLVGAQDVRWTLSAETATPDQNTHTDKFEYAPNLGVALTYQRAVMYQDIELYFVSQLNNIDYLHFQSTLAGFNIHVNSKWRFYSGVIRPGLILRDGHVYPMIGIDGGLEFYFNSGIFLGLKTGFDHKTDNKLWNEDGGHDVWYVKGKIGITL